MKKLAIAMLATCALATSFATPASAGPPTGEADLSCSFTSATDPNPEAPVGTQTGYLTGGPIAQNGTITCTIKAGVATHAGSTTFSATASASGSNGVTFLAPTIVSYMSPPETNVYLCDQFNDGTTTWVLDDTTGTWVNLATNPGATCRLAIGAGTDDEIFQPVWDLIDQIIAILIMIEDAITEIEKTVIDPVVCPVLASLAGTYGPIEIDSEGDITIAGVPFWDCPLYGSV